MPFAERLVHFWANHFAVSADKLELVGLAGTMEFEAIRPHVMGRFGDMLNAVERHPAMLLYLDQAVSIGPNSPAGQLAARRRARQRAGLNENLAREIMELHTLGVRSVYTQADVTEFARAMTGFTVAESVAAPARAMPAPPMASPAASPSPKSCTSRAPAPSWAGNWAQEGEARRPRCSHYLATHPATAKHIATKLARHFASDDPPAPLVARLERRSSARAATCRPSIAR